MNDKNKDEKISEEKPPETKSDLKQQTVNEKKVKKGYNEQNPVQSHGAFEPDSKTTKGE